MYTACLVSTLFVLAGKSRDEKLASRQKAPSAAPLKRSPSGAPASPEQQSTWGFLQWERYATPWEASLSAHLRCHKKRMGLGAEQALIATHDSCGSCMACALAAE